MLTRPCLLAERQGHFLIPLDINPLLENYTYACRPHSIFNVKFP